ncbi:MAG: gfo/Idh/MocA family oxidoreductase, partial [Anaerolineae bacterium]|nr:gfo/Idh/MocA family oxidoreductase [Anaerolineae bacterium]
TWCKSIVHGTPDVITPEHGYHVLEIMLKAEEAGKTGMAQTIESTFPPVQLEETTLPKASIHDPTRTED